MSEEELILQCGGDVGTELTEAHISSIRRIFTERAAYIAKLQEQANRCVSYLFVIILTLEQRT